MNSPKDKEKIRTRSEFKLGKRTFFETEEELFEIDLEMENHLENLRNIYQEFSLNSLVWYDMFNEFFLKIKIIEVIDYVPYTYHKQGTRLFMKSKFWVLYINFVYDKFELKLDIVSTIFNEAFKNEINEVDLLCDFFYRFVSKFDKEIVFSCILKNQISPQKIPDSSVEITRNHYKYVLSNPENLMEKELNKILNSNRRRIRNSPERLLKERTGQIKEENSIKGKKSRIDMFIKKYLENVRPLYSDKEIALNIATYLTKSENEKSEIFSSVMKDPKEMQELMNKMSKIEIETKSEKSFPQLDKVEQYSINSVENFQIGKVVEKLDKGTQVYLVEIQSGRITTRKKENRFYSTSKSIYK